MPRFFCFCDQDLKDGFTVIMDFRRCRVGHLVGGPTFIKIMEHLSINGAGKIIRVVRKSHTVFKQITRATSNINDYPPISVSSLEEVGGILSSNEYDEDAKENVVP